MALTVVTQDLDNYPGTTKNVSADVDSLVPIGYEGDEQLIVEVSTTAYSNNTSRTAIPRLYITGTDGGWCKSSGFAGTGGKFNLDSTHCRMKVKMDATVSGYDGLGYYSILLNHENGTAMSGDVIAADMETKIRAIPDGDYWDSADDSLIKAYRNASVYFEDGKFKIVSGSLKSAFTGANRSSVMVAAVDNNDCTTMLGFDVSTTSEELAGISVKEAYITSNYINNTSPLSISAGTGVTAGYCLLITDRNHTEYFAALAGTTDTSVVVSTIGQGGITYNYTTDSGTKIQILREQDPEGEPRSHYNDMDSIIRWGIKTTSNQIDYSS
jgi:hypothetical protein